MRQVLTRWWRRRCRQSADQPDSNRRGQCLGDPRLLVVDPDDDISPRRQEAPGSLIHDGCPGVQTATGGAVGNRWSGGGAKAWSSVRVLQGSGRAARIDKDRGPPHNRASARLELGTDEYSILAEAGRQHKIPDGLARARVEGEGLRDGEHESGFSKGPLLVGALLDRGLSPRTLRVATGRPFEDHVHLDWLLGRDRS